MSEMPTVNPSSANTGPPEPVAPEKIAGREQQPTRDFAADAQAARVVAVLDEYLAALKAGRAPSREALVAQHPDLADQLDACLSGIEFIHQAETPTGIGRPLGDFRILRELGRGGMGAVYEAQQISLDRRVALKVLRFGSVSDPEALERFQREAETIANLHHTNIVPIFSVGRERGVNFYAMQLVDGKSLDRVAKESPRLLDPETVAEWGLQAAEALAHAHQRGVIHRDVKPSNLILDNEGRIWLTDFGLAKRLDDVTLSLTGALLGTPRYMSPEQAASHKAAVDHRTDIYSLGATLYELATGQPVFSADTPHEVISQILSAEPPPPRYHRRDLPRDLETIVLKCLAKDPAERYDSAQALADDLRAFLDGRAICARRANIAELAARWMKQRKRSVALTAAAVAATLLLVVGTLGGRQLFQQSRLAYVTFTTNEPPLVAEVFDKGGDAVTGAVTVPTQQPLAIPSGEYQVRVAAEGSLSQTYRLSLARGERAKFELTPGDDVMAEIDVARTVALVDFPNGGAFGRGHTPSLMMEDERLALATGDGQYRLLNIADPLPAKGMVWPWEKVTTRFLTNSGYDRYDLRPFVARRATRRSENASDPWTAIPHGDAVDLNGDGQADVVLAGRHQAWLWALSGTDLSPLWLAARGEELTDDVDESFRKNRKQFGVRSAVLYPPQIVDDLDGDEVPDLLAVMADVGAKRHRSPPKRWIESISGAAGTTIWRYDLPDDLFDLPQNSEPPYAFRWLLEEHGSSSSGGGSTSNVHGRVARWRTDKVEASGPHAYISSDGHFSTPRGEQRAGVSTSASVTLLAGSHLVRLDARKGQPIAPSQETQIRAGLPVQWADVDGDGDADALLVEQLPDLPSKPGLRAKRQPRARIAAWSIAKGRLLWSRDVTARWPQRPAWSMPMAGWPLVADIDGDAAYEVIAPNGSSYERDINWRNATPWGALAVFDGATGAIRWTRRLPTMDQLIEHFTVGPDIDGDSTREVYAATLWNESHLYVDCLSGADGTTLWRTKYELGGDTAEYLVGQIGWWSSARDGWPLLIANVHRRYGHLNEPTTCAFSAGTGQVARLGSAVPHFTTADHDGDGLDDFLAWRVGRNVASLDHGGAVQWIVGAHEQWRALARELQTADDFDRDGVRDLLRHDADGLHAISGATGEPLWSSAADGPRPHTLSESDWDLDGDGTSDLLHHAQVHHFWQNPISPLSARSGRTGKLLYEAGIQAGISGTLAVDCRDLDGDGRPEVVLVAAMNLDYPPVYTPQHSQLWLVVLAGDNGKVRWRQPLSAAYGKAAATAAIGSNQYSNIDRIPYELRETNLEIAFADLNAEGHDDILVPAEASAEPLAIEWRAFDGRTGEILWRHSLPSTHDKQSLLHNVPPPACGDLDGDGKLEVAVLAFDDTKNAEGASERVAHVRVLDSKSGEQKWAWQTEVAPNCGDVARDSTRFQLRPRPLLLRHGDYNRIAVNLWSHGWGEPPPRLVVMNHAGDVICDHAYEVQGGAESGVWVCDAEGDGHDELVRLHDGTLALLDPANVDRPLWERRGSTEGNQGDLDDVLALLAEAEGQPPTIVAKAAARDNKVLGIDAATGETRWVCPGSTPSGSAPVTAELLSSTPRGGDTDRSQPPTIRFSYNNTIVVRRAGPENNAQPTAMHLADRAEPTLQPVAFDPRLYRQLPWYDSYRQVIDAGRLTFFLWDLFYCVTLIVLPAAYVWYAFTRWQWSLRTWLLLPAVVAAVLMGFLLAPNTPEHPNLGIAEKLSLAIVTLPVLLLVALVVRWWTRRDWGTLVAWGVFSLVASAAAAGLHLIIEADRAGPMLPEERYSMEGWYLIWLQGAYLTAWAAMIGFAAARLIRLLCSQWTRRRADA